MDVLARELEKLSAYAHAKGRDSLTEADVMHVVAPTFEADAFYFGTLAQRSPKSRETLQKLLNGTYKEIFFEVVPIHIIDFLLIVLLSIYDDLLLHLLFLDISLFHLMHITHDYLMSY